MLDLSIALLLVHFLGHSDFVTRERATTELRRLGPVALPALEYGCRHEDPEIAHRAGLLRRELWLADLTRRSALRFPWLDCIPDPPVSTWDGTDHYAILGHYLTRAHQAGHVAVSPIWVDYREGMRLLCLDLIANGASLADVEKMLLVAWEKHLRWNTATGRYDLPPPEAIGAPPEKK